MRLASRRLGGAAAAIVQVAHGRPEVLATEGAPALPPDLARALCERVALRGRLVEIAPGDPDRHLAALALPDESIGLCLALPLLPTPADAYAAALCILSERRPALAEAEREDLEDLSALAAELLATRSGPSAPAGGRLTSLGTLAAGVAHQINNPIGAILNGAELALMHANEPDAHEIWRAALEDIITQARRCGRIVKSLVQLARADPSARSRIDLGGILRVAYAETRAYARERSAHLDFELMPERVEVSVAPAAMEQLFVSLVRAGIESREVGAQVIVSMSRDGDQVVVRIADNGRGEAGATIGGEETLTSVGEGGGPGLGLSVLHGFIAEHGGLLEVHRNPGRGTTVIVRLPIAERDEQR